ncbi:hypothetical protein ACVWZA_003811 [Sphingomonas sp. UYAg733]
MSLKIIHLRKLLKILYLEPNKRTSALRSEIREDVAKEGGGLAGGGDFYGPFWKDAKDHVFEKTDLRDTTKTRMESNGGRANLYPQLRDGFLLWWEKRRRWTNVPFEQAQSIKAKFEFPGLDTVVKIDNVLSVKDARNEDRFIYPYFSPTPQLSEEAARLGLWLLGKALPNIPAEEIRILDVIRGRTFSIDRYPLSGNEEHLFYQKYESALKQWIDLRKEYY